MTAMIADTDNGGRQMIVKYVFSPKNYLQWVNFVGAKEITADDAPWINNCSGIDAVFRGNHMVVIDPATDKPHMINPECCMIVRLFDSSKKYRLNPSKYLKWCDAMGVSPNKWSSASSYTEVSLITASIGSVDCMIDSEVMTKFVIPEWCDVVNEEVM